MKRLFVFIFLFISFFAFSQEIIEQTSFGGSTYCIELNGNYLFAARGITVEVYNVSGDQLELITSIYNKVDTYISDLLISNNQMVVIGSKGRVFVYDISTLTAPILLNKGQLPEGASLRTTDNVAVVHNNQLFIATYNGIYVTNLVDEHLEFSNVYAQYTSSLTFSDNWFYGVVYDGTNYILTSWQYGSTPLQANYHGIIENYCIKAFDDLLFAFYYTNKGVDVYQLNGSGEVALASQIENGNASVISMFYDNSTKRLFTSESETYTKSNLAIYDMNDPANPTLINPKTQTSRTLCLSASENYLYCTFYSSNEAWLNKYPIESGGLGENTFVKSPSVVSVSQQIDNNLFIGSNMYLYWYQLNEGTNPTQKKTFYWGDSPWGNNITGLAGNNDRLYVMNYYEDVYVCNISEEDIQSQGVFEAQSASENYIYGTQNMLMSIEIKYSTNAVRFINCTDPANPNEVSSIERWGWDWTSTDDENYFILSNNQNNNIEFFDISDPTNIHLAGSFTADGMWNELSSNDSILVLASVISNTPLKTKVSVYNIANVSNPILLTEIELDGQVFDVNIYNDYIFCSMGEDGGVILDFIRAEPSSPSLLKSINLASITTYSRFEDDYLDWFQNTAVNGLGSRYYWITQPNRPHESSNIYTGADSKAIDLPRVVKANYELNMALEPAEAAANGCSVSPSNTVKHVYPSGEIVGITATDNPELGWAFVEWIGASGSSGDKNSNVVMDEDKNVTGKFAFIELKVTAYEKYELCTCELEEDELEVYFAMEAFGDDYSVNKIELEDISPNGYLFEKVTSIDLKEIGEQGETFLWNQRILECNLVKKIFVPKSKMVIMVAKFNIPNDQLEALQADTMHHFKINVFGSAVHYDIDLVSGKPDISILYGPVFNNHELSFGSISEAVNDESTKEGDTIMMCPVRFEENVTVNKSLLFKSRSHCSYDIKPLVISPNSKPAFLIDADSAKFYDFVIQMEHSTGIQSAWKKKSRIIIDKMFFHHDANHASIVTDGCDISIMNSYFNGDYNLQKSSYCITTNGGSIGLYKNMFSNYESAILSSDVYVSDILENWFSFVDYPIDIMDMVSDFQNLNPGKPGLEKNYSIANNEFSNFKKAIDLQEVYHPLTIKNNSFGSGDNKTTGIDIKNFYHIRIDSNQFYRQADAIIFNDGKDFFINNNEFYYNYCDININNCKQGVSLSENPFHIQKNNSNCTGSFLIGNNLTGWFIVANNNITYRRSDTYAIAIDLNNVKDLFAIDNKIDGFCTGIKLEDTETFISQNNIVNSTCRNTGIHLVNSLGKIEKSQLSNNNGSAIAISGNGNVSVYENNFFENEKGINNSTLSIITAQNNYWGNENGPSPSDIEGVVDFSGWLTSPQQLTVSFLFDTIYVNPSSKGEILLAANNFGDPTDSIWFIISDEKGWISTPDSMATNVDSLGIINYIPYTSPATIDGNGISIVKAVARSGNTDHISSDSVILALYHPEVTRIEIDQKSQSLYIQASLNLSAQAYDQYNNGMPNIVFNWEPQSGTFQNNNYYPTTIGKVKITASSGNVSAELEINIVDEQPRVNTLNIEPNLATLNLSEILSLNLQAYDQFGYEIDCWPDWQTDGGNIQSGLYFAPSFPGTFTIIAIDPNTQTSTSAQIKVACSIENTIEYAICEGDTYQFGENELTQTGTYTDTIYRKGLCDSIVFLNLTVNELPEVEITSIPDTLRIYDEPFDLEGEIPKGGYYMLNESVINDIDPKVLGAGTFTVYYYYNNENNCLGYNSTVIVITSENCIVESTIKDSICKGETFIFGDNEITETGLFKRTIYRDNLCDSTITLFLTVNELPTIEITSMPQTFNSNDSPFTLAGEIPTGGYYLLNNAEISIIDPNSLGAGTYTIYYFFTNEKGCTNADSITISISQCIVENTIDQSICEGDPYSFGDEDLTEAGIYTNTIYRDHLCDSIITLNLTVNEIPQVEIINIPSTFNTNDNPFTLEGELPAGGYYTLNSTEISVIDPQSLGEGTFLVYYFFTNDKGCTGLDSTSITILKSDAASWLAENGCMLIYPNPTSNELNIKFNSFPEENNEVTLSVYTLTGQMRFVLKINPMSNTIYNIPFKKFGKGIYFLKISHENSYQMKKVIVN